MSGRPPDVPALLLFLAAPALALTPVAAYTASDGSAFVGVPGEAVPTLRSMAPVTYYVGVVGAPVSGPEIIRLGPGCVATSALVGEGQWFRAPEGFEAVFVEGAGLSFHVSPPRDAAEAC